uniref:nucleotide exchange factor GrpE n=1 Tax=Aquabacterium sp. TaxID=1872578 RepID=UPI0035B320F6
MSNPNENTPENQQVTPDTSNPSQDNGETLMQAENQLEAELATLQDQVLRARADAENIRRRADDEISKARKFAIESFAESLLPVKDSLEAAIATHAAQQAGSVEQMLEGVHATLRQLASALERNKV